MFPTPFVRECYSSSQIPLWRMFTDLMRNANCVGTSHHYKYFCTKTRVIGLVENQPLTISVFSNRWQMAQTQLSHIVFDWMDHKMGKSRKLNDDDMMQMQTWHPIFYQWREENSNPRRARSIWSIRLYHRDATSGT